MLITSQREMIFITFLVHQEKLSKLIFYKKIMKNINGISVSVTQHESCSIFQRPTSFLIIEKKYVNGLDFNEAKKDILDYAQFGFHLSSAG